MAFYRRYPGFAAVIALALLIFVGGVTWIWFSRQEVVHADARLKAKQRELASLRQVSPAATNEVANAIGSDANRADTQVQQVEAGLLGGPANQAMLKATPPIDRKAAYFDIAEYVQRMNRLAKRSGVQLAKNERFGFKAYTNQGPDVAQIQDVFRERQVLEYVLSALFAAGPKSLEQVARTIPMLENAPQVRPTEPDAFVLPPGVSVAKPDFTRTLAFQIRFKGDSAVLRAWLNTLAQFEVPVVVRAIDVEPTGERTAPARRAPASLVLSGDDSTLIPLVQPNPCVFTVSLEYVEPLKSKEGEK